MGLFFILCFLFCSSSFSSLASNASAVHLKSGLYDRLLLAFDTETQVITGYFNDQTNDGKFSCIFYFTGKLNGSTAQISSYFPQTPQLAITGTLSVIDPSHIQISLTEEHGGCWNVQHFADKNKSADFKLSSEFAHWKSIKIVKSEKAHFFDSPLASASRKDYLVRGDAVSVISSSQGRLEILYLGKRKVSGWMLQSDF